MDFRRFSAAAGRYGLEPFLPALREAIDRQYHGQPHGDEAGWQAAIDSLPLLTPSSIDLHSPTVRIGDAADADAGQTASLEQALRALHPWRKGPFALFGLHIDSEWRSDWKWQRLQPHLAPLAGRHVLDVGCGNGYYLLRMLGEGAASALGIDPTLRFIYQFEALRRYLPAGLLADILPLRSEDLPPAMGCFDTVLSMGVLYHRKQPLEHLAELKAALRPGGELVLETLVLPEGSQGILVPGERYAQMRNVHAVPSIPALTDWVARAGFRDIRCVDVTPTRTAEQRATSWMGFLSLADFLDPANPALTVEGHPAPVRAIVIARRPE